MSISQRKVFPMLTEKDEEFQMLFEWAQSMNEAIKNAILSKTTISKSHESGKITQKVIAQHLQKHNIIVSQNGVYITPSTERLQLVTLKKEKHENNHYSPDEVKTAIAIVNNAVGKIVENTRETFKKLEKEADVKKFAIIILSENPQYKNKFEEETDVFTLIDRKKTLESFGTLSKLRICLLSGYLEKQVDGTTYLQFSVLINMMLRCKKRPIINLQKRKGNWFEVVQVSSAEVQSEEKAYEDVVRSEVTIELNPE